MPHCVGFFFIQSRLNLTTVAILQPAGHFLPASCGEFMKDPGKKKGSTEQDANAAVATSPLSGAPFLGSSASAFVTGSGEIFEMKSSLPITVMSLLKLLIKAFHFTGFKAVTIYLWHI